MINIDLEKISCHCSKSFYLFNFQGRISFYSRCKAYPNIFPPKIGTKDTSLPPFINHGCPTSRSWAISLSDHLNQGCILIIIQRFTNSIRRGSVTIESKGMSTYSTSSLLTNIKNKDEKIINHLESIEWEIDKSFVTFKSLKIPSWLIILFNGQYQSPTILYS